VAAGVALAAQGLLLGLAGLQLYGWATDAPSPCQTPSCGPNDAPIEGFWVLAIPLALVYGFAAVGVLARRSWGRALCIVLGLLAALIFAFAATIAWIDVLLTLMILGVPLAMNLFVVVVLGTRWRARGTGVA